jgi:hypothetical protein
MQLVGAYSALEGGSHSIEPDVTDENKFFNKIICIYMIGLSVASGPKLPFVQRLGIAVPLQISAIADSAGL